MTFMINWGAKPNFTSGTVLQEGSAHLKMTQRVHVNVTESGFFA